MSRASSPVERRLRPGQLAVLDLLRKHQPKKVTFPPPPQWGVYDDQVFTIPADASNVKCSVRMVGDELPLEIPIEALGGGELGIRISLPQVPPGKVSRSPSPQPSFPS